MRPSASSQGALGSVPDLGLFCDLIDQVMLPDIGNGYLVDLLVAYLKHSPVRVRWI